MPIYDAAQYINLTILYEIPTTKIPSNCNLNFLFTCFLFTLQLVNHIDTLLEDWYPDLGAKLNQSNEGAYLVERIIPCCACLATPSRHLNNFLRQSLSFSTDNHFQNIMKNSSSNSIINQCKEMDKNFNGNKYWYVVFLQLFLVVQT